MKINIDTFEDLHRPAYVLEEWRLRRNLELIARVAREADVEIRSQHPYLFSSLYGRRD